eukprot:gnl/TRDRNA2_/TRDRNA2_166343_c10_seq1.p1 gnl/TRDRNA2_/TRDRNA2_166343_c10~~gnl/TRDRNA2_/TRDRNA2_166343_c10_seq1.p1  ORF type:complete len:825 (-),score=120.23 gnl/TRDRNA2_/TRDRNA2_166343_c10_seq1:236-2575(-)
MEKKDMPHTWAGLAELLDQQLPPLWSLYRSMMLELPRPVLGNGELHHHLAPILSARGCDLWASVYRASAANQSYMGLRIPLASFQSLLYPMHLLRREGWDALRWWARHQGADSAAFVAYLAGREWVSTGRCEAAREAFIHAEGAAHSLVECLHACGLGNLPIGACSPFVEYYVHVAALFGSKGHPEDEHLFLKKAALLAEEPDKVMTGGSSTSSGLRQELWSSVFEKAVGLELWDDAYEMLMRIDCFEDHLRVLGQKLRSKGRMELMLKLPEKYRSFFLKSLHEHAMLSLPTVGSDSLACYQLLYSLHFSSGEFLNAANIAHSLYCALSNALEQFMVAEESGAGDVDMGMSPTIVDGSMTSGSRNNSCLGGIRTGDCTSKASDVPTRSSVCSAPTALRDFSTYAKALDHVWPLLDQQRSALLMLISAVSLVPDKILIAPPAHIAGPSTQTSPLSSAHVDAVCSVGSAKSPDLAALRRWASEMPPGNDSMSASAWHVVSLRDAERLLAIVEARMVLSGRSNVRSPLEAATAAAELGLLGLALQVAKAHGLDPWEAGLQSFTKLCVRLNAGKENGQAASDSTAIASLVDAARGPAQSYMFVRTDGCEPLGSNGSLCEGLWQTLEETLRAIDSLDEGLSTESRLPTAESVRLHSLVADEVLILCPQDPLPQFLVRVLSAGPSWVCLLRLYMKHLRIKDAIELLKEQHKLCTRQVQVRGLQPAAWSWSPLQDFPICLVLQLRSYLNEEAVKDRKSESAEHLKALDAILTQFQSLLEDSEERQR